MKIKTIKFMDIYIYMKRERERERDETKLHLSSHFIHLKKTTKLCITQLFDDVNEINIEIKYTDWSERIRVFVVWFDEREKIDGENFVTLSHKEK